MSKLYYSAHFVNLTKKKKSFENIIAGCYGVCIKILDRRHICNADEVNGDSRDKFIAILISISHFAGLPFIRP